MTMKEKHLNFFRIVAKLFCCFLFQITADALQKRLDAFSIYWSSVRFAYGFFFLLWQRKGKIR
jgi:hypothetical protein